MIYDASHAGLSFLPRLPVLYHGDCYSEPPARKPFDQVQPEAVRNALDAMDLPERSLLALDIEGSREVEVVHRFPHLAKWHPAHDPSTALAWRRNAVEVIRAYRPDLRLTFYPQRFRRTVAHEHWFAKLHMLQDRDAVNGYPTGELFPMWQREVWSRIGAAAYFRKSQPLVWVTHQARDKTMNPAYFADAVDWLLDLGLEVVFWAPLAVKKLPFAYKWTLYSRQVTK